jgi:cytochrome c
VKTIVLGAGIGLVMIAGAGVALAQAAPKGDAAHGQQVFARCAACHKVGPGAAASIGPVLNGVVGRKAGSVPGYRYSAALKGSGLTWNQATLAKFLQAPMKTVPGTKMIFPGLPSPKDQADVVAYLQQYGADGSKK